MIIGATLLIMGFIMFLSIIMGSSYASDSVATTINNDLLVNGTTNNIQLTGDTAFYIDPLLGAIVIIIGLITLCAILGVRILGSGISGTMSRMIMIGVSYAGIWGMMSVLSFPLIASIEIFGGVIYIALTFAYVVGIVSKLAGGKD